MAFGLFKKDNYADTIYYDGVFWTMDPEFPEAEAVACKDGQIQAVGDLDYLSDLQGPDTEMISLDNKYVYPGFINVHSKCVSETFDGMYQNLEEAYDLDELKELMDEYCSSNPQLDTYLGFGFKESIFHELDKETVDGFLDEISSDKPILLLDDLCASCKMNSTALKVLEETAEEECVQIITLPYIISLFLPFEYDEVQRAVLNQLSINADRGFTGLLTLETPDFMSTAFMDALLNINAEEDIKQRYYGSLLSKFPVLGGAMSHRITDKSTMCIELGDMVSFDFLNVYLDENTTYDEESLYGVIEDVTQRNYNVYIDACDEASLSMAYKAADRVLSGSRTKSTIVIASDYEISQAVKDELLNYDGIIKTGLSSLGPDNLTGCAKDVESALADLTTNAALILGLEESLGSIEPGKFADFTIFDENILGCSFSKFNNLYASKTIVGGEIVYDAEVEAEDEMYDLISKQQF